MPYELTLRFTSDAATEEEARAELALFLTNTLSGSVADDVEATELATAAGQ